MATIKLTFYHTRNIFIKNEFKPFIKKYFKDARFNGTEHGNYYPSIIVNVFDWEKYKYEIPKSCNLQKVDWYKYTIVEAMSLGIRNVPVFYMGE